MRSYNWHLRKLLRYNAFGWTGRHNVCLSLDIFRDCMGRSLSTSKLYEYVAKPPSKSVPSWRRLAMGIKQEHGMINATSTTTATEASTVSNGDNDASNEYVEKLRKLYDPNQEFSLLEDELREEMAQALGKTGSKCEYFFLLMQIAGKECDEIFTEFGGEQYRIMCDDKNSNNFSSTHSSANNLDAAVADANNIQTNAMIKAKQQAVDKFNQSRRKAIEARAELVIHRQSIGLIWRNQQIVEEQYPLLPARIYDNRKL